MTMQLAGWVLAALAVLLTGTKYAADWLPTIRLRVPRPHLPAGHGRHRKEDSHA